jgi:hypothetical protein
MGDSSNDAAWPDELDALVAAPDHHTLLYENDRVRVLDAYISAGDQTPVHIHGWPAVLYILSWSPFVRYDESGTVLLDSRAIPALQTPPRALWSPPIGQHSLLNVGVADLRVITVELKR